MSENNFWAVLQCRLSWLSQQMESRAIRSLQHPRPPSLSTTGFSWRWSTPPSFFIFLFSTQPPLSVCFEGSSFENHIVGSTGWRTGINENMELLLLCFTQWWILWPCLIISRHIRWGQIFIPDLRPLIWWRPDLKAPSKEPFKDSVPSDVPSNEI